MKRFFTGRTLFAAAFIAAAFVMAEGADDINLAKQEVTVSAAETSSAPAAESADAHAITDEDSVERGTEDVFTAIVTSDLHYSQEPDSDAVIVPLIAKVDKAVDALFSEVIDRAPDVFIVTGDLTNSGKPDDERALAGKLAAVSEAGIPVLVLPGNHDCDHLGFETFEAIWEILMPEDLIAARDENSASYVCEIGDKSFFAMDDSSARQSPEGFYLPETLSWMQENMEKERSEGREIFYLAHHPVLLSYTGEDLQRDRCGNAAGGAVPVADVSSILKEEGADLLLTGHLHSQQINEQDGLYEIVSAMPWSGMNYIGILTVSWDGGASSCGKELSYRAERIDFLRYGSEELAISAEQAKTAEAARMDSLFDQIFETVDVPEEEKRGVRDLFAEFFDSYSRGTIGSRAEEILSDPLYPVLKFLLADKNYGPWMENALHHPPLDATKLTLTLD